MGRVRAASLVLAALAVGFLLAACGGGGDELLPGTTADQINSNLDQVRASFQQGDCEKAEDGVANVSTEVEELGKVDARLKKALKHGAAKLSEVVSTCKAEEEERELAAEEAALEEQAEIEAEELTAEEEAFEKEQKAEEREEKKTAKEKAEEHAEQPGPSEQGEEAKGKAKGHEKQEESVEPPIEGEEEVTPPDGGPAGGIGPGAEVQGGGEG